jgi:hypothetical protein
MEAVEESERLIEDFRANLVMIETLAYSGEV